MKKILLILASFLSVSALAQQKVSILGDSYSTFYGYIPAHYSCWYPSNNNDVKAVEQTWWMQFISTGDYVLEKNDSYSGSTVCNTGYNAADFSDRAFFTRVNMLGHPDIIFILGGTNDSWAGAQVGSYQWAKWNHEDLFTYRPALAYLLTSVKQLYPKAEIYFVLNDGLREEIISSTEKICTRYKIDLIKLRNIDKQDGHPSIAGMKAISDQIVEYRSK